MAGGDNSSAIRIDAGVLAKAMKHAAGVVETRNTVPILSNVLLRAEGGDLEIVTTDLDVEFRQRVCLAAGGSLAATVDARRLQALVTAVDAKAQISLEVEDRRLIVKAGRSRWQLPMLPADDFPLIPVEGLSASVEFAAPALSSALSRVLWSVCTDAHRPYLHGPLLHADDGKCTLAATQGNVLTRVRTGVDCPAAAPDVILGPKFCRILQSLSADASEPISFAWNDAKARAEVGSVTLTGKTIEGTYPDYRRVVPPAGEPVVVEPAALRAAIRRVTLVATDKTRAFKLERGDGKLTLSVSSPEGGAAREEVPAEVSVGRECGFNAAFVDRMLEAIGGDSVEIHHADPGSPALFRRVVDDGAIGVVMPMRV